MNRIENLRLGSFPMGSPASRAAARALLKMRERAASQEADIRIVFDLGTQQSAGAISRNVVAKGKVIEFIFPARGECLGVFEVPRGITVEEALRRAKARRFNSNLVIDLEPGRGQAFAPKGLFAPNP